MCWVMLKLAFSLFQLSMKIILRKQIFVVFEKQQNKTLLSFTFIFDKSFHDTANGIFCESIF